MSKYQGEMAKVKRDMKATTAGNFAADRSKLLNYENGASSTDASGLIDANHQSLARTSDRVANARRIGNESEVWICLIVAS